MGNAAETWKSTTNTLSSWWSSAASSVSNVINENLGDGMDKNGAPKLYNNEHIKQEKKMPSLSSDQYFENKNEKIAPLPFGKNEKKKKINVENDDFDEWGFEDDEHENGKNEVVNNGNDKVETLLDFEQNEKKKTEIAMDPFLNDGNDEKENVKDGNSSDDLDAFFNEMEQESDDE